MINALPTPTPVFMGLSFKLSWRDYQARILTELENQLDDDHLHIVAAPGSGKTILGIEVIRRISRPCLILAPTITIRNQWIHHLCNFFLPTGIAPPDWISKDIRNPGLFTAITYQALHSIYAQGERGEVIARLAEKEIATLVLDEAHHLRKEWSRALVNLKASLPEAKTISLTATPPYDVSAREWKRYEELCGPIDAEISVPELVKRNDLCPHQDYIHFSIPIQEEAGILSEFRQELSDFLKQLKEDQEFLELLQADPWIAEPEVHIHDILEDPAFFTSIIIYLNAWDVPIPQEATRLLGASENALPPLTIDWLEILLTGVLYKHVNRFSEHKSKLVAIRKALGSIGVIERKKIRLKDSTSIQKLLTGSLGKLNSILEITRAELEHMGSTLRQVILTDFIRKEELPTSQTEQKPINKLGAVPIFEHIRRADISGIKPAILTGSLIIIPMAAKPSIEQQAHLLHIDPSHLKFRRLRFDDHFARLDIKGEQRQKIVKLITEVFNEGHINTLIGTKALLGEGWDAPSINTLILASNVGSYMQSNQMRGRAIRVDPKNPKKTANIWHLVSVDLNALDDDLLGVFHSNKLIARSSKSAIKQKNLGYDVSLIRRRFKAFVGLSYTEPVIIENGYERLNFTDRYWTTNELDKLNHEAITRAHQREQLPILWKQALVGQTAFPRIRRLIKSTPKLTEYAIVETLEYLVLNGLIGGTVWAMDVFKLFNNIFEFRLALFGALGIMGFYSIPRLIKASTLWIRNGTVDNHIKQIGKAVLETLHYMGSIKTHISALTVVTLKDSMGMVHCRLDGASTQEQRLFLKALGEVLSPVEYPRFVIVRKTKLSRLSRVDYFAVPEAIGFRRENISFFRKRWHHYIGQDKLVDTRSLEGQGVLLKARTQAFSSAFSRKTEQIISWE